MKIIFLTNDTVEEFHGGAQLNTRSLVLHGRELGHEVSEMTVKTYDREELKKADLVVLVALKLFKPEDIYWVADNCKFIKAEMDYAFCKFGNCKCFGEELEIDKCGQCNPNLEHMKLYDYLLDKSQYFVFFTPQQREHWRTFFGDKVDNSILYLQFYDDDKKFTNMGLTRLKNSILWVGRFSLSKGVPNILKIATENPDMNFYFVGKASTPDQTEAYVKLIKNVNNCTYLGHIPHDQLPLIYNLCEKFIYYGLWPDTGPATIVEAMLCGCQVLTEKHLATILSNDFKSIEDIRNRIRNSKDEFWNKIKEAIE